jgi:hypothetical protein
MRSFERKIRSLVSGSGERTIVSGFCSRSVLRSLNEPAFGVAVPVDLNGTLWPEKFYVYLPRKMPRFSGAAFDF